ncbi:hypothetical protein R1flu_021869 [Riccia fluitans]|uniref:FAD-binding PCMH-type domain-containing protein n=1 Tax=Riccia fluitans TaxID=41844 RepID=A0ABD1ZSB9_9MARC
MTEGRRLTNWAGNYHFSAKRFHRPRTVEEVQQIVMKCRKLRVLGVGHSFNGIGDCDEDLISLERMNRVLSIDHVRSTVTVEAGIKYSELGAYLHSRGYGLHNLAALGNVTVAGAVVTATHGSGDRNGNLATAVSRMQIVNGRGEVIDLERDKNSYEFDGAVVSLGGLGVVTKLTLDVVPTYDIRQDVYQKLSFTAVQENLEKIFSSAYSVSLFIDWKSSDTISHLWLKSKVEPEAKSNLREIDLSSALNCTSHRGIPRPWHERLPHNFNSEQRRGAAEYLLPRRNGVAALQRIEALKEHLAPVVWMCEVRTIAADKFWMSPFYKQDCIAIHFSLFPDWPLVSKVLPMVDQTLKSLEARPHWGKVITMPPDRVRSMYCELPKFRLLLQSFDPEGKFRNRFLNTYIFGLGPVATSNL